MDEKEFLLALKKRAIEQEHIIKGMPLPNLFSTISIWLGDHPWRILIPIAFIISLTLHFLIGNPFDTLILKIFGGFGFIKLLY